MSNFPLISVVMPVYNAEKYLDEAIQSILNQTCKDFEFIIINDGSTDKSFEIIEKYKSQDERIVLINRENRGLILSLNEGIKKARGKYIARMDADDVSLSNRFHLQLEFMEQKNLDICGGHYFIMNDQMQYIDSFIAPISRESFLVYLSNSVPFAHPSVMIKKEFLMKNNLNYGSSSYVNAEDYALWNDIWRKKGNFGNVDDFILKYREVSVGLSKSNKVRLYNDAKKISREFMNKNKDEIIQYINKNNFKVKPLREQYYTSILIFYFAKKEFSFKILKLLRNISKRQVLLGFLTFISKRF